MKYMIDCTFTKRGKEKPIHGAGNLEFETDRRPQTPEEWDAEEKEVMEQFGFDSICIKKWSKEE